MLFRTFRYNKLCRDKVIEIMEKRGSKVHWKQLNHDEYVEQLKIKLLEETQEVISAQTRESVMVELADVLEVISSFCDLHSCTLQDIVAIQNKKRQEFGGFKDGKFITTVEHEIDSFGEKYCLADSNKYPEIKG